MSSDDSKSTWSSEPDNPEVDRVNAGSRLPQGELEVSDSGIQPNDTANIEQIIKDYSVDAFVESPAKPTGPELVFGIVGAAGADLWFFLRLCKCIFPVSC